MKLVYLANVGIPIDWAHSIQIMKMCESFALAGADVELVVPNRKTGISDDPFVYYGVERNFKITKIPCIDIGSGSTSAVVFWLRLGSFLVLSKLYLSFKKYDVLYTREQFTALCFSDFVFEIHALPKEAKKLHKKIWYKSKALIVLTSFIKQRLVEKGTADEKILVEADAVPLKEFAVELSKEDARHELQLPTDKKIIGYIGALKTMAMEKGVTSAVLSLKDLSPEYMLMLVGGEEKDIIFYKELVEKEGLAARVLFIGRVQYTKIPKYLKACDVLVAPFPRNEHYNYFMSPLKIFEYMASKRPIITTDLPSLREVLDEKTAVLIDPDDEKALGKAIQNVIANATVANSLAENAFQKVQECTWNKRAKRILDFIKNR